MMEIHVMKTITLKHLFSGGQDPVKVCHWNLQFLTINEILYKDVHKTEGLLYFLVITVS
jgi:hypothetical protein